MKDAAAQKGVRQAPFDITGNHYNRWSGRTGRNHFVQKRMLKSVLIQLEQQIVGKITRCFVDFIDQEHRGGVTLIG